MKLHLVTRLSVRALIAAAPLLAAAPLATGCGNKSAELRLSSLESGTTFLQNFPNAYVSNSDSGRIEIVLVDEQSVTLAGGASGEAIQASAGADATTSVRQVMHLKVLWKPQRGTKPSHPSYTNAGLHWYVFGGGGETPDVLEYSGAGFVMLSDAPGGTQVTIKNATLKPVGGTTGGSLTDPVGPARLTGTFLARKSPQRVTALLAEVKTAVGGATIPQASAQ
jgi:hypothetical protein